MIRVAISFFLLAIVAYVLGAYEVAGLSLGIGKIFLLVFLVLAVVSFLVAFVTGRRTRLLP